MTRTDENTNESGAAPAQDRSGSALGGAARFVGRHPLGVLQGVAFALVAIVVLQNLEPVQIEVLFWSVPEVPKLVLMLIAMLVGAAAWEVLRRALRHRGKRA